MELQNNETLFILRLDSVLDGSLRCRPSERRYRFRLRLFPEESGLPLQADHAALTVQDQRWEKDVPPATDGKPTLEAVFDVDLKKGATWVETELDSVNEGIYRGAFYVYVEYLSDGGK